MKLKNKAFVEPDMIIVAGAPGIGKSTLGILMGEALESPVIDFGRLREFHLDREWKRASATEEAMAFEILIGMIETYFRHGVRKTIVNDIYDWRVPQLMERLPQMKIALLTLYVNNPEVLRERIEKRNKGWRDVDESIRRNQRWLDRPLLPNETRLDVTSAGINEVAEQALRLLAI